MTGSTIMNVAKATLGTVVGAAVLGAVALGLGAISSDLGLQAQTGFVFEADTVRTIGAGFSALIGAGVGGAIGSGVFR